MSKNASKTWLVAYDIADARRLRKIHRLLRRAGASVQYSAYSVCAGDDGLHDLLHGLAQHIDEAHDDIRAYHLPAHCKVWTLGCQELPEGIIVDADTAARMLLEMPAPEPTPLDAEELA
ncbi:CRISPR-associated endonuclease Cas2 [Caldimonas sp.]|uniref:CRISPR-associated endonuclease Cas2 n=1 Tax=Caldimonas sp. TaxID=2838790 RepID=UPI0021DD1376|nr:CRISPR-associated endonuclease Cas2 [Caldimonas manganoxidans]GIX24256.1 MAG: hypothetical protein KatS3mg122_1487 [Caldimonas sp.]